MQGYPKTQVTTNQEWIQWLSDTTETNFTSANFSIFMTRYCEKTPDNSETSIVQLDNKALPSRVHFASQEYLLYKQRYSKETQYDAKQYSQLLENLYKRRTVENNELAQWISENSTLFIAIYSQKTHYSWQEYNHFIKSLRKIKQLQDNFQQYLHDKIDITMRIRFGVIKSFMRLNRDIEVFTALLDIIKTYNIIMKSSMEKLDAKTFPAFIATLQEKFNDEVEKGIYEEVKSNYFYEILSDLDAKLKESAKQFHFNQDSCEELYKEITRLKVDFKARLPKELTKGSRCY
jgi:hypothetical protein